MMDDFKEPKEPQKPHLTVLEAVRKSIKRNSASRTSYRGSSFVNSEILREEDSEKISYLGLKSYIRQNHPCSEEGKRFSICASIGSLPSLI